MAIKTTTYICEFCGREFDDAISCEFHEEVAHEELYDSLSNEELATELQALHERGANWFSGKSVMGMPRINFDRLLEEVAKRLEGDG